MKKNINCQLFCSKKRIRNFVLRYRKKNFMSFTSDIKKLWKKFVIEYKNNYLCFKKLFKNNFPIVIEIGFGKGKFFVKKSLYYPNINFLGIDVHQPSIISSIKYASLYKINNMKIIHYNAIDVLLNMIPDKTIFLIQIFFPDPWFKRKHYKRRIIQNLFINLLAKKLVFNGFIHIKTDIESYSNHIKKIFSENLLFKKFLLKYQENPLLMFPLKTKYEIRGINLGNQIFEYFFQLYKY